MTIFQIKLPGVIPSAPQIVALARAHGARVHVDTAYGGFFALIAEVGPTRMTVITYVNPAVAVLLGIVVLGEPVTAGILIGFPLVLLGSFLATRRAPAMEDEPVPA